MPNSCAIPFASQFARSRRASGIQLGGRTVRLTILGAIIRSPDGAWQAPAPLGSKTILIDLDASYDPSNTEPQKLFGEDEPQTWAYRGVCVLVKGADALSPDQVQLEIKHAVLRHDKRFLRLRREIEAFENLDRIDVARRERIPDAVRLFVWQRDQGKCVRCGSTTKLEFDHIIPLAKGGSNTDRNIQLLCELCNRTKGTSI